MGQPQAVGLSPPLAVAVPLLVLAVGLKEPVQELGKLVVPIAAVQLLLQLGLAGAGVWRGSVLERVHRQHNEILVLSFHRHGHPLEKKDPA